MSSAARSAVARRAATARWIRHPFGAPSFEALGLPGGELVDAGLADLASGRSMPAALAVSLAAPRLRREGVPVRNVARERFWRHIGSIMLPLDDQWMKPVEGEMRHAGESVH